MRFDVISIFPEMIESAIRWGVIGRSIEQQLISVNLINPRDYAADKHRTVDDRPYGGGPGMVMKVEPLFNAVRDAKSAAQAEDNIKQKKVVYLSPQGRVFNHEMAKQNIKLSQLILVCGRYEGVDERFIDSVVDEEWSLGDFVISGGEIAAMVVIDAMSRLVPGVLGHNESAEQDSFASGLLDYPHYTRPPGGSIGFVPEVLLNGNHADIARWREKQSLGRTWLKRPDLLENIQLSFEQKKLLDEFINEI